ncbi:MAG: hypothetical protein IJ106_10480 [Parasporobacterium sp.]|nr:hypothetical protein [Parasporobacterium sp.]
MAAFATIQDVTDLWRAMSADEQTRAENLLPVISDILRRYAHKVGKDLDEMIAADESGALATTAKAVVVNIVARTLNTPVSGDVAALSQYSQSGLGYTVSGTFVAGGRTIFIMKSDLADLGLRVQRYGVIDFMTAGGDD